MNNMTMTGDEIVDALRGALAGLDENGLPPTITASELLGEVVELIEEADADWTESGRNGAPGRDWYVDRILSGLSA